MKSKLVMPFLLTAVIVGLNSCSSKLNPLPADYVKATPQPLEVVGEKIQVTIDATFPEKWFPKKATVVVTPKLKYDGGEVSGTAYTYQGEKVAGNAQVIPQKTGANVTMRSVFDYKPGMLNKPELYLAFDAKLGSKAVQLPDLKIGEGLLATATLADAKTATPSIAPDAFQKVIKEAYDANILFLIQKAELRSSELKKSELSDWKSLVKEASQAPNKKVSVEVSAYASPDGGVTLNDKLAAGREKNTNDYLSKELKKSKVDVPLTANYTAQDWEGFKQLVEKSNIQDKNLILRVLSTYADPAERETQIKNISSVYAVLADEILPQLRRSRLTANVEIVGKSDAEITQQASSNPKSLSVEELLYAATLTQDIAKKAAIYKSVTQIYPNDYRGFNNLGAITFKQGNVSQAESLLKKAAGLSSKTPETYLNLGLIALTKNDIAGAEQNLGKASSLAEAKEALGILALKQGDYSKAAISFGNTASNNAALAHLLNKDYNKAQSTLNSVKTPDAATAYLKAVVAARVNNLNGVVSNLGTAIKQDKSLAKKALTDTEFVKYITNSQFLNIVK
jgi:Flp pilus assembly protein TadD